MANWGALSRVRPNFWANKTSCGEIRRMLVFWLTVRVSGGGGAGKARDNQRQLRWQVNVDFRAL